MKNSQKRHETRGRQQQGPQRVEGNYQDTSERSRNRGGYQGEHSGWDRENRGRDSWQARNEPNFDYSSRRFSGYGGGQEEEYGYPRGERGDYGPSDYGESEYSQGRGNEGADFRYDEGRYGRSGQGYGQGSDFGQQNWGGQRTNRGFSSSGNRSRRNYFDEGFDGRMGDRGDEFGYGSEGRGRGQYSGGGQSGYGSSESEGWGGRMSSQSGYGGSSSSSQRGRWTQDWGGAQQSYSQQGYGRSQGIHAGRGPQGYKRSDDRITEDINEALTQDGDLDATNITVETKNGEVTLKGTVSDREDKRRAEDLAEQCSGVKDVQNQIRVKREDESDSESRRSGSTGSESDKRSNKQQIAS